MYLGFTRRSSAENFPLENGLSVICNVLFPAFGNKTDANIDERYCMKTLSNKICIEIWDKLPKPSLRAVKEESGRLGYINPATNKAYSRQWIRVLLSKNVEGRRRLGRKPHKNRVPVIVEDRPQVLEWYRQHGFMGYRIIPSIKVTVGDVEQRIVYGDVPLSIAHHAGSIYLVDIKDEECPLKEYKVKRIK